MTQSIHIHLAKSADTETNDPVIPADAYASFAAPVKPNGHLSDESLEKTEFVIATDAAGQVLRVVSQHETERHIVGALVGSWVARGYRVQYLDGMAALLKVLRKSMKSAEAQQPAVAAPSPAVALTHDDESASAQPGSQPEAAASVNPADALFA